MPQMDIPSKAQAGKWRQARMMFSRKPSHGYPQLHGLVRNPQWPIPEAVSVLFVSALSGLIPCITSDRFFPNYIRQGAAGVQFAVTVTSRVQRLHWLHLSSIFAVHAQGAVLPVAHPALLEAWPREHGCRCFLCDTRPGA